MNTHNYSYDLQEDIERTMYDRFIDALNAHFNQEGPLVISAPKDGGDVFQGVDFTQRMGEFVFTSIVCDGVGLDTIRGYVEGACQEIFDAVGGLQFEFDITSQGRNKQRVIDAERQIRGFTIYFEGEDANENTLMNIEQRWNAARST